MYHRSTLPNGLRIVGEIMPHVHSISLGLWVGAGSRDERPGREGISHLIEHMFFKGTARRSARDLAEAIDAVGGQINAFTTREYTCFYVKLLEKHAALGLEILADMFCCSLLDPAELAKEKGVVLEEIKAYEDDPDELVHDLLAAAFWPEHPLGRPILGTAESVTAFSREEARSFIDDYYQPGNVVLAAAGSLDFSTLADLAAHHLSALPTGKPTAPRIFPAPAAGRLSRWKDTEQVHFCLGGLGVERRNPDKFAVHLLDSILGGSASSRLFQKLREDRGLVYATGSTHLTFRDAGLFMIYAGTAPDRLPEVIRLIQGEMRDLMRTPVAPTELARAKEQLRGNFLLGLESTNARMARLAKAELFYDSILTPEEIMARVDAVSAADVQRLAQQVFGTCPLPAAAVAPKRMRLNLDALLGEGVCLD